MFKKFFKIILIVLVFVAIGFTNSKPREVTLAEGVFTNIVTLPERLYTYIKNQVMGNEKFFAEIDALKAENAELKAKVEELEKASLAYDELNSENETLKSHINFADNYPNHDVIVADIIMRNIATWEATYIINRGEKDGVTPGMTVIAKEGLVGVIDTVTASTAKVISILDAGNAVSARVTRTRDEVTCKGIMSLLENGEMKILNIPLDTALIEGDKIETSGLGGVYPKGLTIGKVTEVVTKKNPLENEAIVKSSVDFDKLETVAVIVK